MARPTTPIQLSESDRKTLQSIVKKGSHKSRKITRSRALLGMDAGKSKAEVMELSGIDSNHYHRIKSRYLSGGMLNAIEERPRSGQPRKLNERLEAQITSIACSAVPEGSARWTLRLINERLVELGYEEKISNDTIGKVLKKANLNRG